MNRSTAYLCSSIGKKQIMALTGLGWCGFVLTHMVGNLLYLMGPDAYNGYSYALTSNHLIFAAEAGLVFMLLAHIWFAMLVTLENRKARPIAYQVKQNGKGAASVASKTMALSGLVILVFIVLHLITFKYGQVYPYQIHGEEGRDLHRLMTEVFASPLYTGWYILAIAVLAMHLSHALWSSLQTLGLAAHKEKPLRCMSAAFGWIVAIGFLVNPIFIFFFKR